MDLAFERGEGAWLVTADGTRYLDFMGGIAVNVLGHAHPHVVAALKAQAEKLWHVSNIFEIPGQRELGERLVANTFADRVFFGNSGAEAMECAIKTARRYHYVNGAARALPHHHLRRRLPRPHAGHSRRRRPAEIPRRLRPEGRRLRPGAVRRHEGAEAAIGPETAAILIEPIQGEGGVRPVPLSSSCATCGELCDEHGLLLIFDEIQSGMGRTGRFLRA